jgi:hypothetical protein
MTEVEEAFDELDSAARLVGQSRFQFFVPNLRRWFRALDGYPPFAAIVLQQLDAEIEFDGWYQKSSETLQSMVGSGRLLWPPEPQKLLALQLMLFRKFEREDLTPYDFCSIFLYSADDYDAMVRDIVDQLFDPMVLDLQRYLKRVLRNVALPVAPPVVQPVTPTGGERARFLEVAPLYYAVAIVSYFQDREHRATTAATLVEALQTEWGTFGIIPVGLLETPPIFWKAIDWMVAQGLVRMIDDEFAPTMILRNSEFTQKAAQLSVVPNTPLQKFKDLNGDQMWLTGILFELEERAKQFGITEKDYNEPDLEWEPIPLDRTEPELQKAITRIDEVVEAVRSDNGYAATLPEERAFVLDGLTVFATRLRNSDTISVPFLQAYGLTNITKLIKRFGLAAVGVLAMSALEGIKGWLKTKTGGALEWLFK